jgi:PIN domain nuclease of toxin-antitoxin system
MDAESLVYVSPASIWELIIKANLGRLDLCDADLASEIAENGFYELPITARHVERAGNLPRIHNDPFDRMLVAQAMAEDLTCVTRDAVFSSYGVRVVW